nr:hypothetical protein [Nannocystis pusilla]
MIVALSCWPLTCGRPPNCPADTCAFWAWIAALTSSGVILYEMSLSGFSQIRIAYCEPNACTSPTPGTRLIGSCSADTT